MKEKKSKTPVEKSQYNRKTQPLPFFRSISGRTKERKKERPCRQWVVFFNYSVHARTGTPMNFWSSGRSRRARLCTRMTWHCFQRRGYFCTLRCRERKKPFSFALYTLVNRMYTRSYPSLPRSASRVREKKKPRQRRSPITRLRLIDLLSLSLSERLFFSPALSVRGSSAIASLSSRVSRSLFSVREEKSCAVRGDVTHSREFSRGFGVGPMNTGHGRGRKESCKK